MASKKDFQTAPKPKTPAPPTDDAIDAYVRGGAGNDNPQTHISTNEGKRVSEPLKRLSVDIPLKTHLRFKTVCSASGKKMTREIEDFINRRIVELEKETGITQ